VLHIVAVFSRVISEFMQMSGCVAFPGGRAFPRLALTGLALIWLAGCSSDVTRFDTSSNPFTNPFGSQTASATPSQAAPAGHVASAPLAAPTAVASAPVPAAQAVGGSATGWSARGGTPVVVSQNDTLDTLSLRYGVPAAALLKANGLSSAADVKSGMHIVVPVYSAGGGRAVAEDSSAKAKRAEVASNDDGDRTKGKKTKADEKSKSADKGSEKTADKSKEKTASDKIASTPPKTVVAKADPAAPAAGKKPAVDDTPTGNVDPKAASAKAPATAEQADASGSSPEFRWPARGRIIEGFKSGGNDGINISVPSGTSVRAAESGVVVYSGDGLKGYGNLVLIKHPNGFVSAYANNGELDVKRGEQVKRGQIIAKSGDTGNVNAPQLHFELRKGSTPVDPTQYLAGL
jgi:murein DD-endopeptidase MepM/ murein hydrolase activator NlpD